MTIEMLHIDREARRVVTWQCLTSRASQKSSSNVQGRQATLAPASRALLKGYILLKQNVFSVVELAKSSVLISGEGDQGAASAAIQRETQLIHDHNSVSDAHTLGMHSIASDDSDGA